MYDSIVCLCVCTDTRGTGRIRVERSAQVEFNGNKELGGRKVGGGGGGSGGGGLFTRCDVSSSGV